MKQPRRGMALYAVVLVVALLALAGAAFLAMMSTEFEATQIRGYQILAQNTAQSGIAWIQSVTALPQSAKNQIGRLDDNPTQFCAVPVFGGKPGDRLTSRFTVVSPKIENSTVTGIRYGLTNESGKLHLAKILEWEQQQPGAGKNALLKLPGMTENAANCILDWIDPDDQTRPGGAELVEYQRLQKPFGPRNTTPATLEELLLVQNVTRQQLFGGDENFNGIPDEQESAQSQSSSNSSFPLGWTHFLTVTSAELDASPDGLARIDLNQSNLEFLHKLLSQRLNKQVADFVILYRQYGPTVSGVKNQQGTHTVDFAVPPKQNFSTPLDLIGAVVEIPSTKQKISSPIAADQTSLEKNLLRFLDQTTTFPQTVVMGRININEAPREVLEGIPGLPPQSISRIINRREALNAQTRQTCQHPSWLLVEKIVDLDTLKLLWPNINCGGDVFRAQVVGFLDETGTFSRRDMVVDATVSPPREVFSKDLTSYGIGYSNDVLYGR